MRVLAAILLLASAAVACERPVAPRSGCRFADDCGVGEDCREGRCTSTVGGPLVEQPGDEDDAGVRDAGFTGSVVPEPATCATSNDCATGESCILGACVVGCGDVTYDGVCDGRMLYYCEDEGEPDEGIVVLDCGTDVPAGATAACGDVGGGFMACAVQPGEVCLDDLASAACLGDDAACVVDAQYTTGTCVEGVGKCDPAVDEPQCVGDVLVEYCPASGQAQGPRCADLGARCEAGACRDVPPGGACDAYAFRCAAGSVCVGEEDDGWGVCEQGCGDVTLAGLCDGDTVVYCTGEGTATERVDSYECLGETPTCGEVAPGYYDCAARIGERCVFQDAQGASYARVCDGVGASCLVAPDGSDGTCRADVGTCVEPAAGSTFAPTCFGQVLAYDCYLEQVTGYDCAALGGTCGNQSCVNLPVGAPCAGDMFTCGSGLSCETAADGVQRCR